MKRPVLLNWKLVGPQGRSEWFGDVILIVLIYTCPRSYKKNVSVTV
jgi:hypothetical protein